MTKILALVLMMLLVLLGSQYFTAHLKKAQTAVSSLRFPVNSSTNQSTSSLPSQKVISQKLYNSQTFNNCGPANLAMLFSYTGINTTQDELGKKLRPYQVAGGNNDDKSVFLNELADEAISRGLVAYYRPNGTNDLMKQFIAQDIPVVTRQWLHENEDIGHYRLIRGYNDQTQEFISDDSYIGANQRFHYDAFDRMWEPFNYEYLVIAPKDKQATIEKILGSEKDELAAWQHANDRAQKQIEEVPTDAYAQFNLSTSFYYLAQYQKSIDAYEKVAPKLTSRMLWYQVEPIEAYAALNYNNKVLAMTQTILQNNNQAFSELYVLRAKVFLQQGEKEKAAEELSRARKYNQNLKIDKALFDATKS